MTGLGRFIMSMYEIWANWKNIYFRVWFIFLTDRDTKPVIIAPPPNIRVTEGDFVILTCNATGQPTPIIRWFDRHGLISSHPSHILRSKSRNSQLFGAGSTNSNTPRLTVSRAGSSSLYIRTASLESSGQYICEASNKMGSVQAEASLSVGKHNISVWGHSDHTLTCIVIIWYDVS